MEDSIRIKQDWVRFPIAMNKMAKKVSKVDVPLELDKIAFRILTTAKRGAPVRTGALRASGRVKRTNQYLRIIQFGGRGTGVDYATYVEFGTFRQRPKPFLRPAVMKHKKELGKRMRIKVEQGFDKVAKQFPPTKGVN